MSDISFPSLFIGHRLKDNINKLIVELIDKTDKDEIEWICLDTSAYNSKFKYSINNLLFQIKKFESGTSEISFDILYDGIGFAFASISSRLSESNNITLLYKRIIEYYIRLINYELEKDISDIKKF